MVTESETAQALLPLLGGSANIVRLSHCATRLRLVVHDNGKIDHPTIGKLDLVKGSFNGAGQVQVIVGPGIVDKVHDALEALYALFHPTTGGPDGNGWPFGRPVVAGEVFAILRGSCTRNSDATAFRRAAYSLGGRSAKAENRRLDEEGGASVGG